MKLIIDIPDEVVKNDDYLSYFNVMSNELYDTLHNAIPYKERPTGDVDLTYNDLDIAKRGSFREVFKLPS